MTKNPESRSADIGWTLLVGGIIAWDVFAPETLSDGADRYLEHPVGKYLTLGAVAIVASHLLNIPDHYEIPDPLNSVVNLVNRGIEAVR